MPEEHVMLIDETQEKRPHKNYPRRPNKWLRKSALLPGLRGAKGRRERRIEIVRNKQTSSSLIGVCCNVPCMTLSRLATNQYCRYVCFILIACLLLVIYTTRQNAITNVLQPTSYNSLTVPSSEPVSGAQARNRTNFVQNIYFVPSPNRTSSNHTELPPCPAEPPNLRGRLNITTTVTEMDDIEFIFPNIVIGGHYSPDNCTARDRVAIIIPYRNREKHLATLLLNLHPMLMRQNIDYTMFVVEQVGAGSFNRAKLFNVGYFESIKNSDFDCFIFHDVDLVPEDDRNLYTCPSSPRHMSVAVDKFNYKLPYKTIFGGVCAMTLAQFKKVNGFSNLFWGWGGEDDDMYKRIAFQRMKIERYSEEIARYTMLKHETEHDVNRNRFSQLKKTSKLWKSDGLNSCSYKVESIVYKKLYTHILVDLLHPS